jgi:uncharacterized membrane protein
MAERILDWAARASTALLAVGLAFLMARPDSVAGARVVYVGVAALMLTPITRVLLALTRSARLRDSTSVWLAATILTVVAASVAVAFS